ncbi:hypothetical protein [Alteraurantiacibacter palmitatis]|uniref:Uncharacterized protein n=1 Tax=Alteraurantiacibacter palmitatis TaxID=2054628 RepID=A0ABV7E1J8_9SPHN
MTGGRGFSSDRRGMLRLAAAAAILPVLASRSPALAAQTDSIAAAIAPPSCTMLYRRTLERQMAGGAIFTVTREYAVHFLPRGTGFEVAGEQVAVRASAPAALARFAALEEDRVDNTLFPLLLNHAGFIEEGASIAENEQLVRSLREAHAQLPQDAAEAGLALGAIQAAGASLTSQLPRDLFAPANGRREARETITLPWGDAGEVRTLFEAARDPGTGLMREARREVVTSLAGDERRSVEMWALFPLE